MLIHVKIYPESSKDSIEEMSDTAYVVRVKEKAERNAANIKMRALIAEYFYVDLGKVRIITGHHAPSKIVEIKNEK